MDVQWLTLTLGCPLQPSVLLDEWSDLCLLYIKDCWLCLNIRDAVWWHFATHVQSEIWHILNFSYSLMAITLLTKQKSWTTLPVIMLSYLFFLRPPMCLPTLHQGLVLHPISVPEKNYVNQKGLTQKWYSHKRKRRHTNGSKPANKHWT
jgi:hypothetical protein